MFDSYIIIWCYPCEGDLVKGTVEEIGQQFVSVKGQRKLVDAVHFIERVFHFPADWWEHRSLPSELGGLTQVPKLKLTAQLPWRWGSHGWPRSIRHPGTRNLRKHLGIFCGKDLVLGSRSGSRALYYLRNCSFTCKPHIHIVNRPCLSNVGHPVISRPMETTLSYKLKAVPLLYEFWEALLLGRRQSGTFDVHTALFAD